MVTPSTGCTDMIERERRFSKAIRGSILFMITCQIRDDHIQMSDLNWQRGIGCDATPMGQDLKEGALDHYTKEEKRSCACTRRD